MIFKGKYIHSACKLAAAILWTNALPGVAGDDARAGGATGINGKPVAVRNLLLNNRARPDAAVNAVPQATYGGKTPNRVMSASQNSAAPAAGGSRINRAEIGVEVKSVGNEILGGSGHRGSVRVGTIINSDIKGETRIRVRGGALRNSIYGGNQNEAGISLGSFNGDEGGDGNDGSQGNTEAGAAARALFPGGPYHFVGGAAILLPVPVSAVGGQLPGNSGLTGKRGKNGKPRGSGTNPGLNINCHDNKNLKELFQKLKPKDQQKVIAYYSRLISHGAYLMRQSQAARHDSRVYGDLVKKYLKDNKNSVLGRAMYRRANLGGLDTLGDPVKMSARQLNQAAVKKKLLDQVFIQGNNAAYIGNGVLTSIGLRPVVSAKGKPVKGFPPGYREFNNAKSILSLPLKNFPCMKYKDLHTAKMIQWLSALIHTKDYVNFRVKHSPIKKFHDLARYHPGYDSVWEGLSGTDKVLNGKAGIGVYADAVNPARKFKRYKKVVNRIAGKRGVPGKQTAAKKSNKPNKKKSKEGGQRRKHCPCAVKKRGKKTRNRCFAAGTLILTRSGMKPIEDIGSADLVASRNFEENRIEWKPVLQTFQYDDNRTTYRLTLQAGDGRRQDLEVTGNHPFYVRGRGWVDSVNLEPGMEVPSYQGGLLRIAALEPLNRSPVTYNFEVKDNHNYFAGALQAVVHNTSGLTRQCICQFSNAQLTDYIAKNKKRKAKNSLSNYARYERYLRQRNPLHAAYYGGSHIGKTSLSYDKWFKRSRGSRRGGSAGSKHDLIQLKIYNLGKHVNGARTEWPIGKSGVVADVYYPPGSYMGNKKAIIHQIGGLTPVKGKIIAREQRNLDKLKAYLKKENLLDKVDIYFWDKNQKRVVSVNGKLTPAFKNPHLK